VVGILQRAHDQKTEQLRNARSALEAEGIDPKQYALVGICRPNPNNVMLDARDETGNNQKANSAIKKRKVTFHFDTGANKHYVGKDVDGLLTDTVPDDSRVGIANGKEIAVECEGTLTGTLANSTSETSFRVKKSKAFSMNLFSGVEAIQSGCRVVLDQDFSFVEHKATGEKFPLRKTEIGWFIDLHIPMNNQALGALDPT
jgi:hypothetical protein